MATSIQDNEDGSISIILRDLGDLGELRHFLQIAIQSNIEKGRLTDPTDINILIEQAIKFINERTA